jgi:hypothetical protein
MNERQPRQRKITMTTTTSSRSDMARLHDAAAALRSRRSEWLETAAGHYTYAKRNGLNETTYAPLRRTLRAVQRTESQLLTVELDIEHAEAATRAARARARALAEQRAATIVRRARRPRVGRSAAAAIA